MTSTTIRALLFATTFAAASFAHAQDKGCLELKTIAETEQEYLDARGQKATRLVPAAKVVPGDEVIWTITAKNVCSKPADRIVIANPVPAEMSYVANSAMGVGTDITYSLDGKDFKASTALTVTDASGVSRSARADEFRAVRWTYPSAFAPGATSFVRYRAIVR